MPYAFGISCISANFCESSSDRDPTHTTLHSFPPLWDALYRSALVKSLLIEPAEIIEATIFISNKGQQVAKDVNIDENVNNLFQSRSKEQGTRNIFNYSNPEVDAILQRFNAARRDSDAKNAYLDLHAKLSDELPYLFLWKLDVIGYKKEAFCLEHNYYS